jgi:hypothetical protein
MSVEALERFDQMDPQIQEALEENWSTPSQFSRLVENLAWLDRTLVKI